MIYVSVISVKNVCAYSIVVLQFYVTHIVEIYCLIYYSFWVILHLFVFFTQLFIS